MMSGLLWGRLLLLVSRMTSCRWPWRDVLSILIILSMMTLTVTSNWMNLLSWIFSWKFLSITKEIGKSILFSCGWILHAYIFTICSRSSWISSFFSSWFFGYLRILSHWYWFLTYWCSILTLTWRLICRSWVLNEQSISLWAASFSCWWAATIRIRSILSILS